LKNGNEKKPGSAQIQRFSGIRMDKETEAMAVFSG